VRNEPARTAGGQPLPVVGTQVVTLPNVLSFLRLVGVPVFLWLIVAGHDGWALAVLMASGISDYLDGKIARHYGLVSRIGQLLDPLADRLYILSTLLGLAYRGIIPWWLVGVLVAREVFGTVLLLVVRRYGYVGLPVHFIGKAATFNLLYAFPLLLMAQVSHSLAAVAQPVGWAFVWWGTGLYWVAGAMYAVQVRDLVRAARAETR
jgi:cardiolipin synthase